MAARTFPRIRAAIAQVEPVYLNTDASMDRALEVIARAGREGAELVAFGETWLPGYPAWVDRAPRAALWQEPGAVVLHRILRSQAIELPGPELDRLLEGAHEHGLDIVMGCHEREGGTLYNTMLLVSRDGRTWARHRKLVPTFNERLVWGRGDGAGLVTLETPKGTVGGLICWEHWMPLARAAMHARREAVHVAQWPGAGELHQIASRSYAFEGQCFVLAAAVPLTRRGALEGFDSLKLDEPEARAMLEEMEPAGEELLYAGGSAIIAPDAGYLAGPIGDGDELLIAELDLARVEEGVQLMDSHGHYSRPDIFELRVHDRPHNNVIRASD